MSTDRLGIHDSGQPRWWPRRFERHPWLPPLLVFVLALIARVAMAAHLPERILWFDGTRYMLIADHLLHDGGFGSLRDNRFSVPTQPLLLAACRLLFGDNLLYLRLFFAVIGATSCAVGYWIARHLFGAVTALLAGVGLALYPHYIYMSALFEYPQTFFILAMGAAFLAYYRYLRTQRLLELLGAGLALGMAVLTVPTVIPFVPALLAGALLNDRSRARVAAVLVLLLATVVPVGCWATRNYLQYGEPILVNRGGGFALWTANNEDYYLHGKKAVTPPCAPGYTDNEFCRQLRSIQKQLRMQDVTGDAAVSKTDAAQWALGMQFIRESWQRTITFSLRKLMQFWSPWPDAVNTNGSYGGAAGVWLAVLAFLPLLLGGFAGLLLTVRRWRELLPIYAYFAVFSGVYSVFLPTTRYRLPLDFFLVIFSAYALSWLLLRSRATISMGTVS